MSTSGDAPHPIGPEPTPVGFETNRLAAIDLEREIADLAGRFVRLSRTTIRPGGHFDLHSHAGRPEIIHVLEGVLTEVRCDTVLLHHAGDTLSMTDGVEHALRNDADKPVTYLSISVRKLS